MYQYRRLKDLREDNDLKQQEVAELLGTTQRQYSRWETGESEIPAHHLATLSIYYDVSVDFLMGLTNVKKRYK